MSKRIINGAEVSDAQVQRWADEAEAGYDVELLKKRPMWCPHDSRTQNLLT